MSSKLSKDIYENLLQTMYIFYYLISTYFYKKTATLQQLGMATVFILKTVFIVDDPFLW